MGFVFGNLSTHYTGNISDVTLPRLSRLSARLVTVFLFDDVELHILWGFFGFFFWSLLCLVLTSPHFFLISFHDYPQPHHNLVLIATFIF